MVRYASKHISQSLFDKRVLGNQTYNLKTSGYMWKFGILNDCYIIRQILCAVQGYTRNTTGELRSETHVGRSLIYNIVCVYCKSVYTSPFGMQLDLTTKFMYLMIACMYYTPNGGFTANDTLFYKNKVGQQYNTLQFQLIAYAITKITISGTTVPLYEFAAEQAEK